MAKRKIDKAALRELIRSLDGIDNEQRADLLQLLSEQKTYGLVWEEHTEDVEEKLRTKLPVLVEDTNKRLAEGGEDAPNHILIEGDNLHALTALTYTHEGAVDVIYIDPPYNTGNKDFVYNDSFVDSEDDYRHSKWLSFMSKRLRIAKRLLSDRGVIFISIDDNEQANLKLLCDEVFGEKNFVADMIWRGGKRNLAKWISTSHEYMLLYAKNISYCSELGISWKEKKKGLKEIYAAADECKKAANGDYAVASSLLKKWFKKLPENHECRDHEHYCHIDNIGVYCMDNVSRVGGGMYSVVSPLTGNIINPPTRGWTFGKEEDFWKAYHNGIIVFTESDNLPIFKRYLHNNELQLMETVFYKDRRGSSRRLKELLGYDAFPFPKDEEILEDKIRVFSSSDSTILDFFAGSGTTLHATMQLNAEDGGHRKCILVTNNENNICDEVTYERNKRVINGYTTPKGEKVEGLKSNNLRYYKTDFVERESSVTAKRKLMEASTELLCIKQDLYEEQKTFGSITLKPSIARYFNDGKKQMLIIYKVEAIESLVAEIAKMPEKTNIMTYVFSTNNYAMDADFEDVADKVTLCALPAAIYNAYLKVLPKKAEPKTDENETETIPGE